MTHTTIEIFTIHRGKKPLQKLRKGSFVYGNYFEASAARPFELLQTGHIYRADVPSYFIQQGLMYRNAFGPIYLLLTNTTRWVVVTKR